MVVWVGRWAPSQRAGVFAGLGFAEVFGDAGGDLEAVFAEAVFDGGQELAARAAGAGVAGGGVAGGLLHGLDGVEGGGGAREAVFGVGLGLGGGVGSGAGPGAGVGAGVGQGGAAAQDVSGGEVGCRGQEQERGGDGGGAGQGC